MPKPPKFKLPISIADYEALYSICIIQAQHMNEVKDTASQIMKNQNRYQTIQTKTGIPWWVVGAIHQREASGDFESYLQNGDPLFSKNGVAIPSTDEPVVGPFSPQTWENAAVEALGTSHLNQPSSPIGYWLQFVEHYNGLGYYHKGLPSPYVWSMTDQYFSGLYVSDGNFSASAIDENPGCAAMWKALGIS